MFTRLPRQKINCATDLYGFIYTKQDILDYRTRDLSLNKYLVAEHAIMWAIEANNDWG